MDINKLKEVNVKIIEKAIPKIENALASNIWDCECVEAMSQAIDNLKDLSKMEGYSEYAEPKMVKHIEYKINNESEFMKEVNSILASRGEEDGIKCVMMVMSELMEDLSLLHTRLYNQVIMKLKEVK